MSKEKLNQILMEFRQGLVEILGGQLDAMYLYGSQARGDAQSGSDIDVLIVVKGGFDYSDLMHRTSFLVSKLSLYNDVVISRAFITRERFEREHSPFLMNVRREAITI